MGMERRCSIRSYNGSGRPQVGKDFLKLLHSAGRCGHVFDLLMRPSMCRWP